METKARFASEVHTVAPCVCVCVHVCVCIGLKPGCKSVVIVLFLPVYKTGAVYTHMHLPLK